MDCKLCTCVGRVSIDVPHCFHAHNIFFLSATNVSHIFVLVRYTISCRLVFSLRVDTHSEPLPSIPLSWAGVSLGIRSEIMIPNETWLSRYGKVVINFSGNPLTHEFVFSELPDKPKIYATDYFAAVTKMRERITNGNIS